MAYKAGGLRIPKGSLGQHAADGGGGGGSYSSSQGGSAVALRDDEPRWFPSNSSSPSTGGSSSSSSSSGVLDALVSGGGGSAGCMSSMSGETALGGIGDGRDGVSAVGGAGVGEEGDPSSGGGTALSSSSGGTGRRGGGRRKGRRGGGGGASSRTRSATAAVGSGAGTRGASSSSSSTGGGTGAGASVSEEDENDLGRFELRHRGVGSSGSRTGTRSSREESRKSISEQQQQQLHQQQRQHEEIDEDLSFPHFSPSTPGLPEEVRKQREATTGESDGAGATVEDGGGSIDHRGPRTHTTMTQQQQQQHSHLTGSTMGPLPVGARFGEEELQRQHHLPSVPLASSHHQQHPSLRMNPPQEQQPHVGHVYDPQEKQLYMTHGGSPGGRGGNALVMNSSEEDIVMLQQQELMQSHGLLRSAAAVGSRGYYGGGVLGAAPPPPPPHHQQHGRLSGVASSTGQPRRDVEYMQQQHHADMRSRPRGGGGMHSHPEANEELMLKQPRVGQPLPSHSMQETAATCNREAYVGASIYEGLSAGSTTEIGISRERSVGEIRDYREIHPSLDTRVGSSSNTERGLEKTSGAATHGGVDWRERRGMQGTDASGGSSSSSSGGIATGPGDTQQQRGSLGVMVRAGGGDGDLLVRKISGVVESRDRQQLTDNGVHEYIPVRESGEIASRKREVAAVTEQQLQQVMFNRSRGGTAGERRESHGGDEPHFWEARGVVTSCENSVGRKQHEDQKEEQEEQQHDVEPYKNTEVGKEIVSEERGFSQAARSSSSATAARSKATVSSRSGSAGTIGSTAAASIGKEDANASLHVTEITREGGRDFGVPASEEYSTSGPQRLTPPPPPGKRMRTMSEDTAAGGGGGGGEVREKGFGVGAGEGCEEMGGGGGMPSGPPETPTTTTTTMSRGPARHDTSSSLFSSGAAGLLLLDNESSGAAGAVEEEEEHLLLGPRARLSASGARVDRDGGDGMTLWATGSRDLQVDDDQRPSSGEGELLRCTSNSALISSHAESGGGSSVLMRQDSRSSDILVRHGSGSGEGLLRGATHRTSTSSRTMSTAPLLQQRGSSSDSLVAGDMEDHTSRGASTILYRGGGGGLLTDEGNEEDNSGLGGGAVGGGAGHHEGRHGRGMFWHDDEEREDRRSDDEALISQQQHHREGGVAGERGRGGGGVSGPGSGREPSNLKSVDQRDDDDVDGPGLQFSSMFSSLLEREDPDWRSWRSDPLARKRPQSPPYSHHHL